MAPVIRRQYLGGAAAAVGGLLAAACGPLRERGAAAPAAKPATGPVTLRLNYRSEEYVPVQAKAFTDAQPNIKVELVPNSGYEKLVALIAAGDVGDVIWGSTSLGSYFQLAWHEHFLHLDPLVRRDRYDIQDMVPRTIDTLRLAKDNKLYGLPNEFHTSGVGLFYNVNLFEQARVTPPTPNRSFEDLTEAARKLTADTDRDGQLDQWGLQTLTSYSWLSCILRAHGGEWLEPTVLGRTMAYDRPKAMLGWRWLYDLRHRHRVHPVEGRDKPSFTGGNVAMLQWHQSGIAMEAQVKDRFKMGLTLMPKGPAGKRGSQVHLGVWSAYAQSRYPEEAWTLVKWYTSKENLLRGPGSYYLPGARISAWNDPQYRAAQPLFDVFRKFTLEEGPDVPAIPWNFKVQELDTLTTKTLVPMWEGKQAPEQMIAAAKGEFQALLDQKR